MPTHLEPDAMLLAMHTALSPLAAAIGGKVDVAADPDHALELLALAPAGWRLVLGWPGYGSHPEARTGMGKSRIYAVVQRATGMAAGSGADLVQPRGDLPSMFALIERVKKWILAMRFPVELNTDPFGFALAGGAWLQLDNKTTRQYQHDFEIDLAHAGLPDAIELSVS